MKRGSPYRLAMMIAAFVIAGAVSPIHAETVALPQGLQVTLPDGWRIDGSEDGTVSKTGMRRIQLVCETEACKRTQETCTILMRAKEMEGADDAAKLRSLYASPLARYARLRAVLRSTSRDAEIRKPLEITRIGGRE